MNHSLECYLLTYLLPSKMHYFGQNCPLCIEKVFWGSYCLVCNIGHFDVRTPQNISLNFLFVAFYGYFAAFVQRIVSFRLGRLKNWLKVQVFLRRPQNVEEISHLIWNLLSKLPINWEVLSNFVVFLKIVKYTLKMSTREKDFTFCLPIRIYLSFMKESYC